MAIGGARGRLDLRGDRSPAPALGRQPQKGLGLDLDFPAGVDQAGDEDHGGGGPDVGEDRPVRPARPRPRRPGPSRNIRVRTTCRRSAPASSSAAPMISKQRAAWTSGSGSHDPSGQTGAVPDTRTRSPTRTARLNPMVGSKGEPEEIRCRSVIAHGSYPARRVDTVSGKAVTYRASWLTKRCSRRWRTPPGGRCSSGFGRAPLPVVDIARDLPVSRPAVSQHLRVLKDAGLVSDHAEGNRRVYRVETPALAELRRYLEGFWDEALESFRRAAEAPEGEPGRREEKGHDGRGRDGGRPDRPQRGRGVFAGAGLPGLHGGHRDLVAARPVLDRGRQGRDP